jgi:hypothetical protein
MLFLLAGLDQEQMPQKNPAAAPTYLCKSLTLYIAISYGASIAKNQAELVQINTKYKFTLVFSGNITHNPDICHKA